MTGTDSDRHSDDAELQPFVVTLAPRQVKRSESAARSILHDIAALGLGVGDTLPPEATMLKQYKVGRTTLREALRILETNGIVSIKPGPGGGPVIEQASPKDFGRLASLHFQAARFTVADVLVARSTVEPMAARLAARSNDERARQRLRAAIETPSRPSEQWSAFHARALDFHRCVLEMPDDRIFSFVALSLLDVGNFRLSAGFEDKDLGTVVEEHAAIGEAILAHDADRAEERMAEHFDRLVRISRLTKTELARVVEWR